MGRSTNLSFDDKIPKSQSKVKNLQSQQLFLQKYINSNGPVRKEPLDFTTLPPSTLTSYNVKYNLNLPLPISIKEDILSSEIGLKSNYKKNSTLQGGISQQELASKVKEHFDSVNIKENDVITNFLYKVKHQDEEFKLRFK